MRAPQGPFTPGRMGSWWVGGGWVPPTVFGSRTRAAKWTMSGSRSPPLPWPQADHCRTSPVFSLHFLPLGHIWSRFVASSKEGMQTCQPATIPAVFQADGLKGLPDDFGKLGEWVWGGSYVVMGREPSPASRGSPKPSSPLGTDALYGPEPTSFSPRDKHQFLLSYFSTVLVSKLEWASASSWRAC